jgi:acetyl esterase/lipase
MVARSAKRSSDKPMDIAKARAQFVTFMRLMPKPRWLTITNETVGGIPVLRLNAEGTRGTVLHFHGGAYVVGIPDTARGFRRVIRDGGPQIVSADYRLAPEHPYPAAVDDALAVYEALREQGPVAIAGESAGGGLALALVQRLLLLGRPLPVAVAVIAPWADLTQSGDSMTANAGLDSLHKAELDRCAAFYAGADLTAPEVSPIFGAFDGHPPTLIEVGGNDLLLDDGRRLHERMSAAGVDVTLHVQEGGWHVYQPMPFPEGRASRDRIKDFLMTHLARPACCSGD